MKTFFGAQLAKGDNKVDKIMTERLAQQIYETFGDDLLTVEKIFQNRNYSTKNLEKLPSDLESLVKKRKTELGYLKDDPRKLEFFKKIAKRMTSGLVEGMEASNIWIDYGDILEVEPDLKQVEILVEKGLSEGIIVRDGSLYRFSSSLLFKVFSSN